MKFWNIKIKELLQSDLGNTLKHAKNYFTGNIAIKGLGFISMPVFTRLMSPEDYGIVSVYNASLGILGILLSLNMANSISRYYYEEDKTDFDEFLSSIFQVVAILLLPISIILIIFQDFFMNWLELPVSLVYFLIIGLFFYIINSIFQQILVSRKRSKEYVSVNIFQAYGSFGLSWLFLVTIQGSQYLLRVAGIGIAQIFTSIWMLKKSFTFVIWKPLQWEHIKYSLKFGLPRLPYVLSGVILSQFDRIMISKQLSVEDAGIYSVGYNVGGLALLIISAITPALLPNFYQMMNDKKYAAVDKLNRNIMWIIVISGAFLMLLGSFLLKLMADEKYHTGTAVIPAVVLGYMFYALAGVYNRYCGYYKVTFLQSIGAMVSGIVNIVLNYYFIPKYGIIAAAYTTAVSFALQALLTWGLTSLFLKGYISSIKIFLIPTFSISLFFYMIVLWVQ